MEKSSCGVGFLISLDNQSNHQILQKGLLALKNVEHRGGANFDETFGDGAGIMTSIPFELFNIQENEFAVANLFGPQDFLRFNQSLKIFENTFSHFGLEVARYREIPTNPKALGANALTHMPKMIQAFIKRPNQCRTLGSFEELLYLAKQNVRTKQKEAGIINEFFFSSLSPRTIIYKALSTSLQLEEFYLDLKNPLFKTNLVLFHRRFSTNTLPSWDKIQPFRLIAHNGEINTIEGNVTAAISREKSLGLAKDQIITHEGTSDTGNLNNMVESLKYRSSIPHINEILAILIPPAQKSPSEYFSFWSRAMEPWDGPALITFCDGKRIGARLDRSGFRPCRWHTTKDIFYLCSEAGSFEIDPKEILKQGALTAGRSVSIHILNRSIVFKNPDEADYYKDAHFDDRLKHLDFKGPKQELTNLENYFPLFNFTKEDMDKELIPCIEQGKEPIGSMGDTARLPALSTIDRSIYDYFYQGFAQVTNPPLDYLREKIVVDLKVILGRKPNIFSPKELIPPFKALSLNGPIISLGQLEYLLNDQKWVQTSTIDLCCPLAEFDKNLPVLIQDKVDQAVTQILNGSTVLILTDRLASKTHLPLPALFVMRAIHIKLNDLGVRLKNSIVVDSGEIKNSHDIAVLISFGASAVCPYLVLSFARSFNSKTQTFTSDENEKRLISALSEGFTKIMCKRGISVLRSYQGSSLFTILGFDQEILNSLFKKHQFYIGGISFEKIKDFILQKKISTNENNFPHQFIYKEHVTEKFGELHSLTTRKSKILHRAVHAEPQSEEASKNWNEFKQEIEKNIINIRDLFEFNFLPKEKQITINDIESSSDLLTRFGSGAMSFGSISAETQRDIILAFRKINGRSNSGEGGENPYYYQEGISASIKQIASGRFGVTAEYLTNAEEVQIKVAQGAKPGEGGQLMGVKVSIDIARARFATPGVSLISPPPHHDIYSIEDLKQLIFELKELKPSLKISVKLVSGDNIGAISIGIVKAGADIILISGGNGGTGAAGLLSMKHAGLPWEIGLIDVHQTLLQVGLRNKIKIRIDGGLFTATDVIKAAIFGAEEFDFGKSILVSQGCIMARVCEKNTCPAGIATQDPKLKEKYSGKVDHIFRFLNFIAEDIRIILAKLGFKNLTEIIGRTDLLTFDQNKHHLDHHYFLKNFSTKFINNDQEQLMRPHSVGKLNQKILEDVKSLQVKNENKIPIQIQYNIHPTDRAVGAHLAGYLTQLRVNKKNNQQSSTTIFADNQSQDQSNDQSINIHFSGSAGQGFGAFNISGINLYLTGEANDGVGKSMSGGKMVIRPFQTGQLKGEDNVIIGNACLYGATGGQFFLDGHALDRFAIRNSGAEIIVEGVANNACEYMTNGTVVILKSCLQNLGAGMTGGKIYLPRDQAHQINSEYLKILELSYDDKNYLTSFIDLYQKEVKKSNCLNPSEIKLKVENDFIKCVPI